MATGPVPPVRGGQNGAGAAAGAPAAAAGGEARGGLVAVPGQELEPPAPGEAGPRRISRPMIAAAAVAGLVLVGLPLVFSDLGGDDPHPGADGPPPAGYTQQDGGGDGFVPGTDAHGNVGDPAQPAGQPPQPGPGDGAAAAGGAAAGGAGA
ncbi:hypothetical protein ACFC1F_07590, partial [Kitasatospora sp. NPDC056181]